jgi:OPT family oligopeptide transporter
MLPGRPIAMMMFKTWGYITMAQALQFSSDMKLGHYMKVPPRAMFFGQVVAAIVAGTIQLGVQAWMFTNIKDMCNGNHYFSCPNTEVFGTASIIWGVIGPQRQFVKGQLYYALTFFFLVGAICPVITWTISRKYPNRCDRLTAFMRLLSHRLRSFVKYVNFPVIFSGTGFIPPASAVNYVPWTIVAFIFRKSWRLYISSYR